MKSNSSDKQIERIAREYLGIETLQERNRDSLDFHEVGVAAVRKALEAAYRAGQAKLLNPADAYINSQSAEAAIAAWEQLQKAVARAKAE